MMPYLYLREAYNYIPDSYVNMPLIFQYYLLNKNLYVHSSKIVIAQSGQFYDTDTFIYWWAKIILAFRDKV